MFLIHKNRIKDLSIDHIYIVLFRTTALPTQNSTMIFLVSYDFGWDQGTWIYHVECSRYS